MSTISTKNRKSTDAAAKAARMKAKRVARAVIRRSRALRLTKLREKTRLSRQEFAKRHALPYGSLQNWEDPKYGGLTKTGAPRVIKAFKKEGIFVTAQWILEGTGPEPYVSAAVLLKRMQLKVAGNDALSLDAGEEVLKIESELEMFRHHYQDIMHLVSSEGQQFAGQVIPLDQANQWLNQPCLAQAQNGQLAVGSLQAGNAPGTYSLAGVANPAFQHARFTQIAPVLWQRRPLNNPSA